MILKLVALLIFILFILALTNFTLTCNLLNKPATKTTTGFIIRIFKVVARLINENYYIFVASNLIVLLAYVKSVYY